MKNETTIPEEDLEGLELRKKLLKERNATIRKILREIDNGIGANQEILNIMDARLARKTAILLPGDEKFFQETIEDIKRQKAEDKKFSDEFDINRIEIEELEVKIEALKAKLKI